MKAAQRYLVQVLIALDQLVTALLGGWADETLSSYAWRLERTGKPWGVMRRVIDALFFAWPDHCRRAYDAERQRAQLPPELRGLPTKGNP